MKTRPYRKVIEFFLAVLTIAGFILFVVIAAASKNFDLSIVLAYKSRLIMGLKNTLIASGYSLVFGVVLGFLLYILRESKIYYIKSLANIFIELMLGTPLLVLVFVTSYFIGTAFNYDNYFVLGIAAMTAYIGPYIANAFKGVIETIDEGQFIAMDLYGFTQWQRYRYLILPQIIKPLMPPMMNNFSYIIKGSSLLYLTAVPEIFYSIKVIQSKTYAYTEGYLVLWAAYLIITIPLSILTKYVEKRFTT